jgi:hypothetical protein
VKTDVLGITVKYEDYHDAHLNVFKINKVYKDGPASEGGIVEEKEFVIGAKEIGDSEVKMFQNINKFANFIALYEYEKQCV